MPSNRCANGEAIRGRLPGTTSESRFRQSPVLGPRQSGGSSTWELSFNRAGPTVHYRLLDPFPGTESGLLRSEPMVVSASHRR